MDTSDNVGGKVTFGERVFDFNVYGRQVEFDVVRLCNAQPSAFARLVKAIALGDASIEDQIFRRWGVR